METLRVAWIIGGLFVAGLLAASNAALAGTAGQASGSLDIEMVTVGNPYNPADGRYNGIVVGSVSYVYQIGKYDITAGQYCQFLNAVAKDDPYGLYDPETAAADTGGCNIQRSGEPGAYAYSVPAEWANRPVNFVSWASAARFCNWLTNNQPTGAQTLKTTEDGSYYLNGATNIASLQAVARRADALYVIPNEDEWYKAAYYDADKMGVVGYWQYPTRSDAIPSSSQDASGRNCANYRADEGSEKAGGLSLVGRFSGSPGPYGTFDQGGNVWQWTETAIYGPYRVLRGGSFSGGDNNLHASVRFGHAPTREEADVGFRIAKVPPMWAIPSRSFSRSTMFRCWWQNDTARQRVIGVSGVSQVVELFGQWF